MKVKDPVFLNISNHPSEDWSQEQKQAALALGRLVDYPFPPVRPEADPEEIRELAGKVCRDLEKYSDFVAMVQGESTLTYEIVRRIKEQGCTAVAACTAREANVHMRDDGSAVKESVFRFVRFREY